MFKAPARSKRRLHAEIGRDAEAAAAHLCACALEDLRAWLGPRCVAAATPADLQWAQDHIPECEHWLLQPEGNLGVRIAAANAALLAAGCMRQIFIGIDCPTLDGPYLRASADALDRYDVVLGPAQDGGVVSMAVRGAWPPLEELPWSTADLMPELRAACLRTNRTMTELASHRDVDCAADLAALRLSLADDSRPSRIALREWLGPLAATQ